MCAVRLAMAVSLLAVSACATTQHGRAERRGSRPSAETWLTGEAGDVTVLIFGAVDCPIANAYAPELAIVATLCAERGARAAYVYPAPDTNHEEATAHAAEFGVGMEVVLDPHHVLVRAVGATVTPEAAVLRFAAADRPEIVYRGRIDDRWAGIGRRRAAATTHDLTDAIVAASEGLPVPIPRTTAYGCFIEPAP